MIKLQALQVPGSPNTNSRHILLNEAEVKMTDQQLYETIFKRKSIRKFNMNPLKSNALSEILAFSQATHPLDKTIRYEFSLLSSGDVKNLLPIKAPHYLCLYSEKKGQYLMNAGFVMQQVDLFLSAHHLGSCWLGIAKPSKHIPQHKDGLEFVIMLGIGSPAETIHRASSKEFNRKPLSAITDMVHSNTLLEPVRLAPSASNSQPWFLSGRSEEIILSREKLNMIKAAVYGKLNQIDIGIALCHLWLALQQIDQNITFDFNKTVSPAGYEFMVRIVSGRQS
jgi:nitroreductase